MNVVMTAFHLPEIYPIHKSVVFYLFMFFYVYMFIYMVVCVCVWEVMHVFELGQSHQKKPKENKKNHHISRPIRLRKQHIKTYYTALIPLDIDNFSLY